MLGSTSPTNHHHLELKRKSSSVIIMCLQSRMPVWWLHELVCIVKWFCLQIFISSCPKHSTMTGVCNATVHFCHPYNFASHKQVCIMHHTIPSDSNKGVWMHKCSDLYHLCEFLLSIEWKGRSVWPLNDPHTTCPIIGKPSGAKITRTCVSFWNAVVLYWWSHGMNTQHSTSSHTFFAWNCPAEFQIRTFRIYQV